MRLGCERYKSGCGNCPQLKSKIKYDWSYRLLKAKRKAINNKKLVIISPSTWMDNNVSESWLFKDVLHYVIPNPIDTDKFKKNSNKYNIRERIGIAEEKKFYCLAQLMHQQHPIKDIII